MASIVLAGAVAVWCLEAMAAVAVTGVLDNFINIGNDRPGGARADQDRTSARPPSAATTTSNGMQTRPTSTTATSDIIPARLEPTTTTTPNTRDERVLESARECIICAETYTNIDDFPPPHILPECSTHHSMDTCRTCLTRHLESRVRSQGTSTWEQLRCPKPGCEHVYTHEQVRCLADAGTFALYDEHGLHSTLAKHPSFRRCLGPGCSNGQIYEVLDGGESSTRNKMECSACGFAMCFKHQCPWHEGSSCDDYDSGRRQSVQLLQLWLANNTKACPGPHCGVPIEKNRGCFHMTCTSCRFEFCWECLADWSRIKLNRKWHNAGCYFRDESAPSAIGVLGNTVEEAQRSI